MRFGITNSILALITTGIITYGAPGEARATLEASLPTAELLESIVRGGRLYDNWYVEVDDRVPLGSHPSYPSSGQFANDPGTNWRCVECHGWDYMGKDGDYAQGPHYTGIKGIRDMVGADTPRIISVLMDDTHGYQLPLTKRDLLDLANFVSQGQIETDRFIDRKTKRVTKASKRWDAHFEGICGHCHGTDGQRFNTIAPLGELAITDPWKTLHKILNGHPGEDMPALRVFDIETLTGLLAYVQTLPVPSQISSIARGGRLYDNWYLEGDLRVPRVSHASYPEDGLQANNPAENWRCAECHGWDYKGNQGAYARGSHATGIKGIRGMSGVDPEKIITILTDETHGYLGRLKFRDIRDLANFVSKGQIDMDEFIDRGTLKSRAPANGNEHQAYFNTLCAPCHGADGRRLAHMSLGEFTRKDPWHALHSLLNGHPEEEMPALRELIDTPVLMKILTHTQSLPER